MTTPSSPPPPSHRSARAAAEILPPGWVALVGAGPGDPGLITVRGLAYLRQADVIFYDHLLAIELLDEARPECERIDASKRPGTPQNALQAEINAKVIAEARRGRRVVRLKGGDPFVFGRGGEEVQACAAAGIPVVVVPGVTSAVAAATAAGIPLTQRGISRGFVVFTASANPTDAPWEIPYDALAKIDSIVILMGLFRLAELLDGLQRAGRPASTPAAAIERAWMPGQRVVRGTLATLAAEVAAARLESPVITVVGAVAAVELPHALAPFPEGVAP